MNQNKQFQFLLYRAETEDISVNALVKDETIWLTQKAMAELFGVDKSGISRHLKNIFDTGELDEKVVVAKFATTTPHGAIEGKTQTTETKFYNLDAILSVGYRVNSINATMFRKWATSVLKDYLLKGYAVNQRIERLENRVSKTEEKIDFFVRTSLPPVEGVFFRGQIFDAYAKFESFIQSAEQEIILIDNYIDISVLERFSKKQKDVKVTIYTDPKTKLSEQDIQKFNEQYPQLIIEHTSKTHDRFLIIDSKILYHIGASLKDLGKKCFAFEIMDSAWIKEILKNL
jgi:prophage antirepressor-like protein